MTKTAQAMSMGTIDQFLSAVGANGQTKSAAVANTEPGSIGGETSHPVKNVEDRTEPAKEGERSAENTKDVKEDQGSASVDSTPEATAKSASAISIMDRVAGFAKQAEGAVSKPGSASEDQLQIGPNKQPTGEDPSNETNKAKGGKDDPGSSHPARTDNESLAGGKYAFDNNTPLEKLAEAFKDISEHLCAELAAEPQQPVKTAQAQAQPQRQKQAQVDPELARQAGWELAGLINGTMDKTAVDAMVENTLTEIIKVAAQDADNVGGYLDAFFSSVKAAEGEMPPGGDPAAMMGGGGGGGGMEGMGGGGGDPAAMMGALGGGDPAGGEMPPDAGGGGDPAGGGGAVPPEVEQLLQQLMQMGIPPEQLEEMISQQSSGGGMDAGGAGGSPGGDPMGGAGGAPPPPPGGGGMEAQASDRQKRAFDQSVKAAAADFLKEVVSRSRASRARVATK